MVRNHAYRGAHAAQAVFVSHVVQEPQPKLHNSHHVPVCVHSSNHAANRVQKWGLARLEGQPMRSAKQMYVAAAAKVSSTANNPWRKNRQERTY